MTAADRFEPSSSQHGLFSLVVGLYVAALVAPLATFLLAGGAPTWQVYLTLLGNALVVTVVAGVAASRAETRLAVRLGRTRLRWALPLAGGGYAAWLYAVGAGDGAVGLAMIGLAGTLVVGFPAVVMANNRAVHDRLDGTPVRATWSAAAGPRRRRVATWVVAASVGAGVSAMAVGIAFDVAPLMWIGQILVPVGAGVYGTTEPREYVAVDEGLVVRAPVALQLVPWDRFEGFAVTDDAIVVERRAPWRFDVSCALADVEDAEAAAAALSAHLPDAS